MFYFASFLFARLLNTSRGVCISMWNCEAINYGLEIKSQQKMFFRKFENIVLRCFLLIFFFTFVKWKTCPTTSQLSVASSIIISFLINTLGYSLSLKKLQTVMTLNSLICSRVHAAIKVKSTFIQRLLQSCFQCCSSRLIKHFY